jgi:type III pantothenate kinase
MMLVVDIGNSQTKLSCFNGNSLVNTYIATSPEHVPDSFLAVGITKCLVAATGDDEVWNAWLLKKNISFISFNDTLIFPIVIEYKTPNTLGSDRLAAVCGAKFLFPNQNLLIIDAGTAITYDILLADGIYKGGNISPGFSMRYRALNTFTKRLPLLNFRESFSGIGTDTESAIHKGIQFGVLTETLAYINDWSKKLDGLKVLVTGGDVSFFEKSIKNNIFVVPHLVAFGLKSILELND